MKRLLQITLLLAGLAWCVPAWAVIARDGAPVANSGNGTTLALTKSPTAGSSVFLTITYRKAACNLSAAAVTDNIGNTYTVDKDIASGDANRNLAIVRSFNVAAGVTTITIHTSATCAIIGIVQSYTGMTSPALDAVTAAVKSGASTTATSNTITTTGANDLLIGMALNSTNSSSNWTATGGSGWTLTDTQSESTNGTVQGGEDQINKAAGTYSAALTASGSVTWESIAASYTDGSSASSSAPSLPWYNGPSFAISLLIGILIGVGYAGGKLVTDQIGSVHGAGSLARNHAGSSQFLLGSAVLELWPTPQGIYELAEALPRISVTSTQWPDSDG